MIVQAPYLSEQQIEHETRQLLQGFERDRGVVTGLPIPVEHIIEKFLKLGIDFDNMHQRLGVPGPEPGRDPDILGAILFGEQRIFIDESLDPETCPSKEGRYRFTLAHETGHWRLHRYLFENVPGQGALFGNATTPSIVCRSSQTKESIEWQADYFASCLLMPRKLVFDAWLHEHGSARPIVCDPEWKDRPDAGGVFDAIARDFASSFGVSVQAMRIRLEKLGLLLREPARQRMFNAGD